MFNTKEEPKGKGQKLPGGFWCCFIRSEAISYGHTNEEFGLGCQLISIWWWDGSNWWGGCQTGLVNPKHVLGLCWKQLQGILERLHPLSLNNFLYGQRLATWNRKMIAGGKSQAQEISPPIRSNSGQSRLDGSQNASNSLPTDSTFICRWSLVIEVMP